MSYTADADLLAIMGTRTLVELSHEDPLASEPEWAVVAEARAYADAQVDARLRNRYRLPLAEVPRELKDWALALARLWLYQRRPDGGELPAAVTGAAKDALAALDAVRDGRMSLALPTLAGDGSETHPPEGARLRVQGPARAFPRAVLDRY